MLRSASGTYYDTLVVQHGCLEIRTTNLVVKPEIILTLGSDTCLKRGKTMELNAHVNGASDYTWQDGTHNQIYTVTGPGEYRVKVKVGQCENEDAIIIGQCPELISISFPSAFTPNGDDINDLFGPAGTNITNFHMIIYNRWGQLLFETSNPGQGWDGKSEGVYCEPGVYVYIATYKNPDNPAEEVKATGSFTLIR
jgi:gliding motility-associated-like protein